MWQILTIFTLLALMYSRRFFDLQESIGTFDPGSLAATGFIVLAAFTMGELFKRLKMPALLGYIAAGIVFGPDLSHLVFGGTEHAIFGRDVIEDLSLINILTVGVIGTLAGGELKVAELKSQAVTIITIIAIAFVAVVPLSAAAVLATASFLPDLIPFLDGAATSTKLAAALLFGVFGFAMSPTVTLAIMQETRASGRFTSLTLGVVVVAELVLVASFLLAFNLSQLMLSPEGFTMPALLSKLPAIGAEFGWALVIGVITGIFFILYLRFVAREKLLFTVGIIFATAAVGKMLHAEQLLMFLAAGFVVQNFSKHGHDMIHALEKISLPVFVIYFMTQAAELDLMAFVNFLPLALILTAVRAIALGGSVKLATTLRKSPEYIDSNLWMAFFSRGSVDIVLAAVVAEQIVGWGEDFRAAVMATVIIHITLGPAILKWVYERVGETEDARKAGSEEVAELDRIVGVDNEPVYEPLERPEFPDPHLNRRLEEVNQDLSDCYKTCLIEQIEQHGTRLKHLVQRIEEVRAETLEELAKLLESAEHDRTGDVAPKVKRLHVQFRQSLQPQIDLLEHLQPMPITTDTTDTLLEKVRGLVEFDEQYRVRMEPWLLEPSDDDNRMIAAVKMFRQMRNSYGRGGHRNVPIGRLWRFYLELSVPAYLASAVAATAERNESFWYHLGVHLRRVDDLFEKVVRTLRAGEEQPIEQTSGAKAGALADADGSEVTVVERGAVLSPSVDALPMSMSAEPEPDEAEEHAHGEPGPDGVAPDAAGPGSAAEAELLDDDEATERAASPLDAARLLTRDGRQKLADEADELSSLLTLFIQTQRERFSISIERAYGDFIDAVSKAGTVELPSFRYRASSRYDEAHRAEARLRSRLDREASLVKGYQGWVVLDHQLILFLHWFRTYQQRIVTTLETRFDDGLVRRLRQLRSRCEERPSALSGADGDQPAGAPDWSSWYAEQIDPALEDARAALDHALTDFGQGIISRRLMDVLEARVARFSSMVHLLVQNPVESVEEDSNIDTINVPLRSWYFSKLLREAALRLVEFNERAERILRRSLVAMSEIRQGLETSLVSAQQEFRDSRDVDRANEVAEQALREAAQQTEELVTQVRSDEREMRVWVVDESTRIVRESTIPFLEHRLDEVVRELNQVRGDSLAQRSVQPLISRLKDAYRKVAPVFEQITTDLSQNLTGRTPEGGKSQVRDRLLLTQPTQTQTTPAIYRRLFSPVPVDIPDFYIERPALEQECLDAVDRWFNGLATSILVAGDRGMGKRSLVHHVLPVRMFSKYHDLGEEQLQTVRIDEHVETERELCESLAPVLDTASAQTLSGFTRCLKRSEKRQIVFVENGDKIYSRTREGLALCERFLDMIEQTSGQTLWIIMMSKPATTLLDTVLQISDYFTHTVEVEPLSPSQIEQMVISRHEVSGFDIVFRKPDIRYLERLHHPLETSDALRNPRKAYFERLGRLSKGSPLLALLYWLETVHVDPNDEERIVVEALPEYELELISKLSLQKQLILATLVQHHALTVPRLSRILRVDLSEIRTELNHLRRLGFVELIASTTSYQLRPLPGALVTQELRARNLV
jgi:Kef-type K+ transport system membrane component KefB